MKPTTIVLLLGATSSGFNDALAQEMAFSQQPLMQQPLMVQYSGNPGALASAEGALEPNRVKTTAQNLPQFKLKEEVSRNAGRTSSSVTSMIGGLAAILALIVGLGWAARRFNLAPNLAKGQPIQLLSALSLGGKEKVMLIEVDQQKILLGVTPQQVTSLHVFAAGSGNTPPEPEFAEKMKAILLAGAGGARD